MPELNSKCSKCGERDKNINHMVSKCRKLVQKEYKTILDRECYALGILQEILIWPYEIVGYAEVIIYLREWDAKNSEAFWFPMDW